MSVPILLDDVEDALKKANFQVSERCSVRLSCFDVAASKENKRILVKSSANLTSISKEVASELRFVAYQLLATPVLVGLRTPKSQMGDDAVYARHGVPAVTPQTLADAAIYERHPLVEAKPGGFYVRLDGKAIQDRRRELGLSLGELASMAGASRRTIYGYEQGLTKASVGAAIRLEATLGIPVVLQIDLFEKPESEKPAPRKRSDIRSEFLNRMLSKFSKLGLLAAVAKRAPFDIIVSDSEERRMIVGIAEKGEEEAGERMRVAASIASVTNCRSLFITDGEKTLTDEFAVIRCGEFLKIEKLKELYDLLL